MGSAFTVPCLDNKNDVTLIGTHLEDRFIDNMINPDNFCMPVVKTELDLISLRKAACTSNAKFFLGTDSAPHSTKAKETFCGCAGMYSAVTAHPADRQEFQTGLFHAR